MPDPSSYTRPENMPGQRPAAAELQAAALAVRDRAYAPYSGFRVGAALRSESGRIHTGVNVENIAYPEGTCAEAGAIAALCAAGEREIHALVIVADSATPVAPCGGCRQKIAEFAAPGLEVTMATLSGETIVTAFDALLPGAFGRSHFNPQPADGGEG